MLRVLSVGKRKRSPKLTPIPVPAGAAALLWCEIVENMSASASASASGNEDGKPLVVRVKRKRLQALADALWVEINDRPEKRQQTALSHSLGGLTLSSSHGIPKIRKLLFHHVETVSCSDEQKGLLELVLNTQKDKKLQERHKEQREDIKKSKDKQDQLRASARRKHEIDAKRARFKQVWRSRKGIAENSNDIAINELYHLYDVDHVDEEEEMGVKFSRQEKVKSEATLREDQVLCNYLPLMREYLPSAAAEFEAQLCSSETSETDDYVYDIYTLEKNGSMAEDVVTDYPLVHVEEDNEFYCRDPIESDVDSDDSNDENNPLNDYPEEESEIEQCQSKDSFDSEEWDSEDEDYDAFEIDEDRRWASRRRS